jgi:predicted nucleic acid-binding protein
MRYTWTIKLTEKKMYEEEANELLKLLKEKQVELYRSEEAKRAYHYHYSAAWMETYKELKEVQEKIAELENKMTKDEDEDE